MRRLRLKTEIRIHHAGGILTTPHWRFDSGRVVLTQLNRGIRKADGDLVTVVFAGGSEIEGQLLVGAYSAVIC